MRKNNLAQNFVSNRDAALKFNQKIFFQFLFSVFKDLKLQNQSVSFVFVTDAEIKKLNRQYLNHSWATDVIAFSFEENLKPGESSNLFSGEVIISPRRAAIQGRKYRAAFEHELARYVIHGLLHLNGFSDKTAKDFDRMRTKEDEILAKNIKLIKGLFRYGHSKR